MLDFPRDWWPEGKKNKLNRRKRYLNKKTTKCSQCQQKMPQVIHSLRIWHRSIPSAMAASMVPTVLHLLIQTLPWFLLVTPASFGEFRMERIAGNHWKSWCCDFVRVWNDQWIGLRENFNRKTPYLMGKSMVSCKFSLKPIHWHQGWFSKHLFSTLPKQRFEELHCGSKPNAASTASFFGFRCLESPGYVSPAAQSCLLCWLRGLSNRHCPPS